MSSLRSQESTRDIGKEKEAVRPGRVGKMDFPFGSSKSLD